jgi:hypothetical protein
MNAFTNHCIDGMLNNSELKFSNIDEIMFEFEDTFSGDAESLWNETALELFEVGVL